MPDYERDALAWADHQAGLLRRVADGERLNDKVDWSNVIEEIQDVGLSELRACRNLLVQAFIHLLKLHAWPGHPAVPHWRGETASFIAAAQRTFTPSMRSRIVLADLYADALYDLRSRADAPSLPEQCPFTLDDVLQGKPEITGLVARLDGPPGPAEE